MRADVPEGEDMDEKKTQQDTDPRCRCGEVRSAHRHGYREMILEDQQSHRVLCFGFIRNTDTLSEQAP